MVWQPNILNNCYELSGGYAPPEPRTRGSAPGPRWGTSVPQTPPPNPVCATVTHADINRARRALTSFMRRTPLTTTPRCHDASRWHMIAELKQHYLSAYCLRVLKYDTFKANGILINRIRGTWHTHPPSLPTL